MKKNELINIEIEKKADAKLDVSHIDSKVETFDIVDLVLVWLKFKFLIISACIVVFVLTCIITLLTPNIYTATTRILPPKETNMGMSAAMGNIGDIAAMAGISVGGLNGRLYVGMLKSRTIADSIIDQFDLMNVYKTKFRITTYSALKSNVSIVLGDGDGIISISADDKDPQRAAAIANEYVEELKRINVRLNLSAAGRERSFLEKRLSMVKADLLNAEEELKIFQKANKAISIDDQANALVGAISTLKAELISKEVQLGVLLSYQTKNNAQVLGIREAISQLKVQLKKLERIPSAKQSIENTFISAAEVPELGIQYARLLREFKIQESLFELLTRQYEIAKINEAKDTSPIQILDVAIVPDRKSKPKRTLIVIAATFSIGIFSMFLALIIDFLQKYKYANQTKCRLVIHYLLKKTIL